MGQKRQYTKRTENDKRYPCKRCKDVFLRIGDVCGWCGYKMPKSVEKREQNDKS